MAYKKNKQQNELRAYKFRIYPTTQQQTELQNNFDAVRYLWNRSLALKSFAYQKFGANIQMSTLKKRIVKLNDRHEWLKGAHSQVKQQSIINLDIAFKNFFNPQLRAKYPQFKSKRNDQSIQYPQGVKIVDGDKLILPKIGKIRLLMHREMESGLIKTVTIKKTKTNKYFASILVDTGIVKDTPVAKVFVDEILGIDTGLIDIVTCSDGFKQTNPKFLKKRLKTIKKEQRKLSRKTNKSSKRRAKQKIKLAKAYEKLTNTRNDFLHKLSTALVSENQVISVETLAIKNLMKNKKLSRAFSDASIGNLYNMLRYKIENKGGHFVKVDRFFASTKTCHVCNHKVEKMPLNIREWACPQCKTIHDRDINAAINIKSEAIKMLRATGTVVLRRGDTVSL
ncbi:MAG: transposase [Spirochaetes bacterium]|nr:MAG: transposase [Spirochaetota bacterium]